MGSRALMKCAVVSVTAAVLCGSLVSVTSAGEFHGGLGFSIGSPQGEFRDNVGRNGFGGTIEGFYRPSISPVAFGLSLSFLNYGSDSRVEPLSTTIPDLKVQVDNDNNIVSGDVVLRYRQPGSFIRPYIDALLGFRYLYTSTSIQEDTKWGGGEEIASSTNFDDMTFEYGAGAGVMVQLYRFENFDKKGSGADLMIDLRCRYIDGGEAEYLKKGSIRREDGKTSYDVMKSRTDMLLFTLGLVLSF